MNFFTTPPVSENWPYILMNVSRPDRGLRYLRRHPQKTVILDSGVEIFRRPGVFDYPQNHLLNLVRLYERIKPLTIECWATIPDYPDDYKPRSLWASQQVTNIERTHANIKGALQIYPEVNWLIPIQGHNEEPESIRRAISLLNDSGIIGSHTFFAVSNLCTSKRKSVLLETVKLARRLLPGKRLHSFGISLTAALELQDTLDSFDSMAWTFPRGHGGHSARTERERIEWFQNYVKRLATFPV